MTEQTTTQNALAAFSGLDALLSANDAEAELAKGVLDHHLHLSAPQIKAATFLQVYGCGDIVEFVLRLRRYQTSPRQLVQALESVSLKRYLKQVTVAAAAK